MKRNLIVAAVFLLVYICLGINTPTNAVGATLTPIQNAGFEEPVMTENEYTFEAPLGWKEYNPDSLVPAKGFLPNGPFLVGLVITNIF